MKITFKGFGEGKVEIDSNYRVCGTTMNRELFNQQNAQSSTKRDTNVLKALWNLYLVDETTFGIVQSISLICLGSKFEVGDVKQSSDEYKKWRTFFTRVWPSLYGIVRDTVVFGNSFSRIIQNRAGEPYNLEILFPLDVTKIVTNKKISYIYQGKTYKDEEIFENYFFPRADSDYAISLLAPIKSALDRKRSMDASITTTLNRHMPRFHISCFDDQTEVLTRLGFKYFEDVNLRDEIATLNSNGYMEYHNPTDKQIFDHDGDLLYFDTRVISLAVTEDHNLYYTHKGMNRWMNKPYDGRKKLEFKRDMGWEGEDEEYFDLSGEQHLKIPMRDYISFMAWYLSEGSTNKANPYEIGISQTKEDKIDCIANIVSKVTKAKVRKVTYGKGAGVKFNDRDWFSYLRQFGLSRTKFIPQEIKNLPREHLRLFLEIYTMGDGHKRERDWTLFTKSERMRDDLQEIILKCGYSTTFYADKRDGVRLYYVSVVRRQLTPQFNGYPEKKHYKGKVYDLTIPNHILLTRRKGKIVWSGNCKSDGMGRYPDETQREEIGREFKKLASDTEFVSSDLIDINVIDPRSTIPDIDHYQMYFLNSALMGALVSPEIIGVQTGSGSFATAKSRMNAFLTFIIPFYQHMLEYNLKNQLMMETDAMLNILPPTELAMPWSKALEEEEEEEENIVEK